MSAQAWLLTYLLGLGYSIARLLHARQLLHGLAAAGWPVSALDPHDGFSLAPTRAGMPSVIEVDVPISPMLFGLFKPRLLLPRRLRGWAQELGCDRDVLRRQSQAQRKAYAAALVAQFRLQHRPAATALAFGGASASTLAARIALIREPVAAPGPWARCAAIAGLAGIVAGSLVFQPALAWRIDPLSKAAQIAPTDQPGNGSLPHFLPHRKRYPL